MDRDNSYRPSYGDPRDSRHGYHDSYSSRPPPPRYDDAPPPPSMNRDADMFHFRGAADRASRNNHAGDSYRSRDRPGSGDNYRPGDNRDSFRPSERSHQGNDRAFDFNFRAGDAPSFPANAGTRPQGRSGNNNNAPRNRRGGRGGHGGRGRGQPWSRRAPDRALLRTKREPTPEQMQGMNDGESRFKVLDDLSDSQSEAMDISDDDESLSAPAQGRNSNAQEDTSGSEDEHPRAKRARVHSPTAEVAAADSKPKWSNPDPYTVLPCPDGTERKNKDVVKLIRKAKVDASKSEAPSSTASDFISLNFDDVEEDDSESDGESIAQGRSNAQPSFSHLNQLHPDRVSAPSFVAPEADVPSPAGMNSLPAGRLDVWPPPPPETDAAIRNTYDQALSKQDANDTSANVRKQNRKRKHVETELQLGDIVEEWMTPEDADPTPWLNVDAEGFPHLQEEILDFYHFVRPREFEEQVRLSLIDRVQQAISYQFPEFKVVPFGSFASGLYLPTADMDLVACSRSFLNGSSPAFISKSMMYKVGRCLETAKMIEPGTLTVIAGARVPIIKFVERSSGLRFDISFENDSGLQAQKTFTKWKQLYPAMPIVVSLIKQFLVMRGMSEVFQGGLGGYSVICLVVSIIRLLESEKGKDWDSMDHLDTVLMEFFRHYGNEFEFHKFGIVLEPWSYLKKSKWNPAGSKKPKVDRLLIVDPNKYNNDISGGSAQVQLIFDMFSQSFDSIKKSLDEVENLYETSEGREKTSILECVWGGNYEVFEVQRARMSELFEKMPRNQHQDSRPPNSTVQSQRPRPGGSQLPNKPPPAVDSNNRFQPASAQLPNKPAQPAHGHGQKNERQSTMALRGGTPVMPQAPQGSKAAAPTSNARGKRPAAPQAETNKRPKKGKGKKGSKTDPIDLGSGHDSDFILLDGGDSGEPRAKVDREARAGTLKAREAMTNYGTTSAPTVDPNQPPQNLKTKKPRMNRKEKKKLKMEKAKKELQRAATDPNSDMSQFKNKKERVSAMSRADTFKKNHPGIDCPKAISKEEHKDLYKRHKLG